jgi:hypothetical protein
MTLRVEAERHGVQVSVHCPGVIRTPILTGGQCGRIKLSGISDEDLLKFWEPLRPMAPEMFPSAPFVPCYVEPRSLWCQRGGRHGGTWSGSRRRCRRKLQKSCSSGHVKWSPLPPDLPLISWTGAPASTLPGRQSWRDVRTVQLGFVDRSTSNENLTYVKFGRMNNIRGKTIAITGAAAASATPPRRHCWPAAPAS